MNVAADSLRHGSCGLVDTRPPHAFKSLARIETIRISLNPCERPITRGTRPSLAAPRALNPRAGAPERNAVQSYGPRGQSVRSGPPSRHTGCLQLDWETAPRPPEGIDIQGFRKRLMAPPTNIQLPKLNALVIVEGFNDCLAVHRAVRSPVFVLEGGYALAEAMKPELRYLSTLAASGHLPRQLVVYTDPDWQGRMFRTYLDDVLPLSSGPTSAARVTPPRPQLVRGKPDGGLYGRQKDLAHAQEVKPREGLVLRHAFVRVELGTSGESSRNHEVGNVGVEHASPDTIRACLTRARPGFGTSRKEFNVEELKADGLVGSWDDKAQVAGPQLRRSRFCRALGIDEVGTGKALVNLLNRFFTREEYADALEAATGHER